MINNRCWNLLKIRWENYLWLPRIIPAPTKKILNIGCTDGEEAITLLWLFEPDEILVIDRESDRREKVNALLNDVQTSPMGCWDAKWNFKFEVCDITEPRALAIRDFDLVYCDNVIYYIFDEFGERETQLVLNEIASLIITGGYLALVEPKVGKTLRNSEAHNNREVAQDWLSPILNQIPILEGDSIDLRPYLEKAGLSLIHYDEQNNRYVGKK